MIGFEMKEGDIRQLIVVCESDLDNTLSSEEKKALLNLLQKVESNTDPQPAYYVVRANTVYTERIEEIIKRHEM